MFLKMLITIYSLMLASREEQLWPLITITETASSRWRTSARNRCWPNPLFNIVDPMVRIASLVGQVRNGPPTPARRQRVRRQSQPKSAGNGHADSQFQQPILPCWQGNKKRLFATQYGP